MRVKFRPMPWLTAIVAIMLAILISLGVWQYKRLQWKTTLLAEVEASVTAYRGGYYCGAASLYAA